MKCWTCWQDWPPELFKKRAAWPKCAWCHVEHEQARVRFWENRYRGLQGIVAKMLKPKVPRVYERRHSEEVVLRVYGLVCVGKLKRSQAATRLGLTRDVVCGIIHRDIRGKHAYWKEKWEKLNADQSDSSSGDQRADRTEREDALG